MGGTIELPFGQATSVGSLPVGDVDELVAMAFAVAPGLPAAPSSGSPTGSLLAQAVEGIDGVVVLPPGLLGVDDAALVPADPDDVVVDLSGPSYAAFRRFVQECALRRPPAIRISHLGPVTLALALRSAGLDDDLALRLAGSVVGRRSVQLLSAVRAASPHSVVLVCASEPGLIGAMHPTFPLAPAQVLDLLGPYVGDLDRHGQDGELLIGVHVPGRTDWETIVASGASVLSMPADGGVVGWAPTLGDFLDRGGRIVWGAVPVDQPLGTGEELLWRRLSALWCELVSEGLDPLQLRSRSLIGPVDGLGHFGRSQAELVLELVDSLSIRVRRQAIGARLSLGA